MLSKRFPFAIYYTADGGHSSLRYEEKSYLASKTNQEKNFNTHVTLAIIFSLMLFLRRGKSLNS